MRWRRWRALSIALLIALVPSCTETARIGEVYSALDPGGVRRRSSFFTDSKDVNCIVEAASSRDATLEVVMRQLQGYDPLARRAVDTNRVILQAESVLARTRGFTEIAIPLPKEAPAAGAAGAVGAAGAAPAEEPFPYGRYACEVSLDGELEGVAVFTVDFPPCPGAEIRPNARCAGFYESERSCRRYGLSSSDPAGCRCTDTGWECA